MRASCWFLCLKKSAITFGEGCRSKSLFEGWFDRNKIEFIVSTILYGIKELVINNSHYGVLLVDINPLNDPVVAYLLKGGLGHSYESNLTWNTQDIIHQMCFNLHFVPRCKNNEQYVVSYNNWILDDFKSSLVIAKDQTSSEPSPELVMNKFTGTYIVMA